uniref:Uncharacterized protein n=1 Tax=Arundo donax TaxID=35708 RepID=A0A0A8YTR4_ARUDO
MRGGRRGKISRAARCGSGDSRGLFLLGFLRPPACPPAHSHRRLIRLLMMMSRRCVQLMVRCFPWRFFVFSFCSSLLLRGTEPEEKPELKD